MAIRRPSRVRAKAVGLVVGSTDVPELEGLSEWLDGLAVWLCGVRDDRELLNAIYMSANKVRNRLLVYMISLEGNHDFRRWSMSTYRQWNGVVTSWYTDVWYHEP